MESVLPDILDCLAPNALILIISYHSLEDRQVKLFFKQASLSKVSDPTSPLGYYSKDPELKNLTKKPITPNDKEIKRNPRSRSAKLRIARKI